MDVYRQAAEIVDIVRAGNGTAKALCLRKEMQKKRQTYAVVCETLRHYELLEDVLAVAEFFKYYPQANRSFALCMAYDVVLGKGISTKTDSTARAVQDSASYLREAYWRVYKHHVIPPRTDENFEEDGDSGEPPSSSSNRKGTADPSTKNRRKNGQSDDEMAASGDDGHRRPAVLRLPRYARVNTLKIDKDTLVSRLRNAAEHHRKEAAAALAADGDGDDGSGSRKRVREDADGEGNRRRKGHTKPKKVMPDFTEDAVVPSLLVFPHGTDLHAHPAVRGGQLILQDRASCLPACVLLDAVEVELPFASDSNGVEGEEENGEKEEGTTAGAVVRKPLEYVIDACAAPGNKTTQLAALGAPDIKLMAIERDERRAELLQRRVQSLGAADYVNVVNMDFFQMSSDDRAATEGILLDPSCSASGVVTRVDVALMHQKQHSTQAQSGDNTGEYAAEENVEANDGTGEQSGGLAEKETRVEKLAALQRKLLAHALLSFDNCRTVVYSTCSVHETENEEVVRTVLHDSRVQGRGWKLSNIMPTHWKTRGITKPGDEEVGRLDYTIRCDPAKDATNGFYVARFDRVVKAAKTE